MQSIAALDRVQQSLWGETPSLDVLEERNTWLLVQAGLRTLDELRDATDYSRLIQAHGYALREILRLGRLVPVHPQAGQFFDGPLQTPPSGPPAPWSIRRIPTDLLGAHRLILPGGLPSVYRRTENDRRALVLPGELHIGWNGASLEAILLHLEHRPALRAHGAVVSRLARALSTRTTLLDERASDVVALIRGLKDHPEERGLVMAALRAQQWRVVTFEEACGTQATLDAHIAQGTVTLGELGATPAANRVRFQVGVRSPDGVGSPATIWFPGVDLRGDRLLMLYEDVRTSLRPGGGDADDVAARLQASLGGYRTRLRRLLHPEESGQDPQIREHRSALLVCLAELVCRAWVTRISESKVGDPLPVAISELYTRIVEAVESVRSADELTLLPSRLHYERFHTEGLPYSGLQFEGAIFVRGRPTLARPDSTQRESLSRGGLPPLVASSLEVVTLLRALVPEPDLPPELLRTFEALRHSRELHGDTPEVWTLELYERGRRLLMSAIPAASHAQLIPPLARLLAAISAHTLGGLESAETLPTLKTYRGSWELGGAKPGTIWRFPPVHSPSPAQTTLEIIIKAGDADFSQALRVLCTALQPLVDEPILRRLVAATTHDALIEELQSEGASHLREVLRRSAWTAQPNRLDLALLDRSFLDGQGIPLGGSKALREDILRWNAGAAEEVKREGLVLRWDEAWYVIQPAQVWVPAPPGDAISQLVGDVLRSVDDRYPRALRDACQANGEVFRSWNCQRNDDETTYLQSVRSIFETLYPLSTDRVSHLTEQQRRAQRLLEERCTVSPRASGPRGLSFQLLPSDAHPDVEGYVDYQDEWADRAGPRARHRPALFTLRDDHRETLLFRAVRVRRSTHPEPYLLQFGRTFQALLSTFDEAGGETATRRQIEDIGIGFRSEIDNILEYVPSQQQESTLLSAMVYAVISLIVSEMERGSPGLPVLIDGLWSQREQLAQHGISFFPERPEVVAQESITRLLVEEPQGLPEVWRSEVGPIALYYAEDEEPGAVLVPSVKFGTVLMTPVPPEPRILCMVPTALRPGWCAAFVRQGPRIARLARNPGPILAAYSAVRHQIVRAKPGAESVGVQALLLCCINEVDYLVHVRPARASEPLIREAQAQLIRALYSAAGLQEHPIAIGQPRFVGPSDFLHEDSRVIPPRPGQPSGVVVSVMRRAFFRRSAGHTEYIQTAIIMSTS